MKKTDEIPGRYATERENSLNNARAMMGWDKEPPTIEVEAPQKVITRRGGKLLEEDRPAFVKIYTDFKKELKTIEGDDLKVWVYLALSVNRFTGDARPGLRKIAEDVGLAVNTVRSILERLEARNLLDIEKEDGKGNIYRPSDYVSANKTTVSKFDTVPPTVSKNDGTVSTQYRKTAQPENQIKNKKGDLVDAFLEYQHNPAEQQSLIDFEKFFGFGTLPWNSNSIWEKFTKFVFQVSTKNPGWCKDYVAWRNGDGKYKAFSNRKIRENPQMFIDTGYPEYEASKTHRPREPYIPDMDDIEKVLS